MMAANIDVIFWEQYTTTAGGHNDGNVSMFQAMANLRAEGYNVPKIAPEYDPTISGPSGWPGRAPGTCLDLSVSADKDSFVQGISDFYKDYYSVNTDVYADSYVAQLSGRVLMACYQLQDGVTEIELFLVDSRRLAVPPHSALGANHALFNNMPTTGTFMIEPLWDDKLPFQDESLTAFEGTAYYWRDTTNGAMGYRAASLMPGYWDQNVRNPGAFLARDGGTHYKTAWTSAQAARSGSSGVKHVNVESWNEYDEGSGIYAANPGAPYIKNPPNNSGHTDTWSSFKRPVRVHQNHRRGRRAV